MSSALRTRRYAGSSPAGKANHRCIAQRESTPLGAEESRVQIVLHRPTITARWPIGQATDSESVQTGSIPVRAANLAPWRNRNAAVCKTAMSRGSSGRGFQHARSWTNWMVSRLLNGPMLVRLQSSAPSFVNWLPSDDCLHGLRLESCRDHHVELESWPSGKATRC